MSFFARGFVRGMLGSIGSSTTQAGQTNASLFRERRKILYTFDSCSSQLTSFNSPLPRNVYPIPAVDSLLGNNTSHVPKRIITTTQQWTLMQPFAETTMSVHVQQHAGHLQKWIL